jgi:octaprenyl-diphosphate synthase
VSVAESVLVPPTSYNAAQRRTRALLVHTATSATRPESAITDPVASHMARVDAIIVEQLKSDVALVNQISRYIVSAGGKRMRPRLVLLFANALGYEGPLQHTLAATVEFIHTATLLHDDVVDESSLRRGRQTANAVFGNAASVLVGDFLYSRAFQMMVSVRKMDVLEVLADATNVIAEGEVLQLLNMHDPDLAVDDYLRVIRSKTAKLFEASARIGAMLAGADARTESACAAYGRSLGTAFQLVDDLLDYDGQTQALGKNVGDDLREGKPTLPLLVAMTRGTDEERALIRQAIQHGEVSRLSEVVSAVRRTGAVSAARDVARAEAQSAHDVIASLPRSIYRDALVEFCVHAADRSS